MKHYKNIRDAYAVCDALGSIVRIEIMEQILGQKAVNLDTLARNLHLTNGALTKHIKKLESAGLIKCDYIKGKRGLSKRCTSSLDKVLIDIQADSNMIVRSDSELLIGLYCDFGASGLCGLVSSKGLIGRRDEKASFLSPFRAEAAAIWLEKGFLSYFLPEGKEKSEAKEYVFTMEVSPDLIGGGAKAESNLSFSLDNTMLGTGTIKAPISMRRGFNTPQWYASTLPQYGVLKTLRITPKATFFDGERLSGQLFDFAKKPSRITISTQDGFILFGRGFGDYDSGIGFDIVTND